MSRRSVIAVLLAMCWSMAARAGDYVNVVAGPDCPRQQDSTGPRIKYVDLKRVLASIDVYYGTAHSKDDEARGLGYGHEVRCSKRETEAVYKALLAVIVRPRFFHQSDYLDTLQLQGTRGLLKRFEALLAQPALPSFARPRVEAAIGRLREKYPR